jgi:hypothetical protein
LAAALEVSRADVHKTFTLEDLLLAAWKRDPMAWGLRGHEKEYPDSERMHVELVRASEKGKNLKGGLVALGLLEKVRQRTYRLTPAGIAEASEVASVEPSVRGKADRAFADAVSAVLSHPVFREWILDQGLPKHFRDAGHFWGIAPGTPPSVIKSRIVEIDNTLNKARSILDSRGADDVTVRHGHTLFDRTDIDRAWMFQTTLKRRFAGELATLNVVLD